MKRWMIQAALLGCSCGAMGLSGCANFTRAEMDLTAQARKGIALIARNDAQRDASLDELARLRRQRLDEAFDADVREHATTQPLDADWVIEARRAYGVALGVYAKTQAADAEASRSRKQLLADIDAAMERLQWMQSIRSRFDSISEPITRFLSNGGDK